MHVTDRFARSFRSWRSVLLAENENSLQNPQGSPGPWTHPAVGREFLNFLEFDHRSKGEGSEDAVAPANVIPTVVEEALQIDNVGAARAEVEDLRGSCRFIRSFIRRGPSRRVHSP